MGRAQELKRKVKCVSAAEFAETYWPLIAAGIAITLVLLWFVMRANRKTSVIRESMVKDVLDEGADKASRNQALIDADAAAQISIDSSTTTPMPAPSGDDLTRIKGLGPKIATLLGEQGITSFADIAAWNDADIDRIDAQLGRFQGRIRRDDWVEQAKLLSAGQKSDFAGKFGNNG